MLNVVIAMNTITPLSLLLVLLLVVVVVVVAVENWPYTRSPLEDSRLFGPSPWKVLATTYEQMGS